ncbi:Glycosyltransferase involved in cell wall bisynthesis [Caloramator fervidus]|uniref:Glycosyltransferase involved in cell wall bisynthesis n=1 Tax=Caloramator fervidus TaxID=29344 RepID=A0A1H5SZI7_9CLOT|nr:glycosyltransferase [Caloramator fervidus]SEF55925.1 Glycosyltransferase involved in cell wall bisynthesis [Caloramator fervidus]
MINKKKALFLTTEIPYPLDNGGKIRSYNLIKGLSKNYLIDLVCFAEFDVNIDDINELKKLCNDIRVVNKVFTSSLSKANTFVNVVKSIFRNRPFIIEKFNDIRFAEHIKHFMLNNFYNIIIFDHLNITSYINLVKNLSDRPMVLSQHNAEYLIIKRRYENEKNILKKIYLKYEYEKTKRFEMKVCKEFKKVIVLSEEDKLSLVSEDYKGDNIEILPISIEMGYRKRQYNSKIKNLLFLGTMSWYPNEHGILWFLDNVFPKLIQYDKDIKLYIVGKNPSEKILKYNSDNIIVTGYVKDVNEYIEKCDICIVPIFIGGGMRVKILECMTKGLPCISTSIGAEGIKAVDGESIIIANSESEFIEKLLNLNHKFLMKIADNAYKLVCEYYSVDAVNNKLISILDNVDKD